MRVFRVIWGDPTAEFSLAEPTGLEPATFAVTGQRSNQLSYGSKLLSASYFSRKLKLVVWDYL